MLSITSRSYPVWTTSLSTNAWTSTLAVADPRDQLTKVSGRGAEHKMVKQAGQAHSTWSLSLNFTTLPRLCSLVSGHKHFTNTWEQSVHCGLTSNWGHSWMITRSFCNSLIKSRTQDQMIRIIAKKCNFAFTTAFGKVAYHTHPTPRIRDSYCCSCCCCSGTTIMGVMV